MLKMGVLALASLVLVACDAPSQQATLPLVSVQPHRQTLTHPDDQIDVFDARMNRTNVIPTNADQRPIWLVAGRIKNHTEYFVDVAWIEIRIHNKATGEEMDSTVLKLDNLRLPPGDGVVAFSQEIRILPPSEPWDWIYNVIHAETEPECGDIRQ